MDIISIRSLRLTSRDSRAARKPDTTQATAGVSVYDDTLAKNLRRTRDGVSSQSESPPTSSELFKSKKTSHCRQH